MQKILERIIDCPHCMAKVKQNNIGHENVYSGYCPYCEHIISNIID